MNTTLGDPALPSAPEPLPANWGAYQKFPHNMDLVCMTTVNGKERTVSEFEAIISAAGLQLRKIWPVRSHTGLLEVVLRD